MVNKKKEITKQEKAVYFLTVVMVCCAVIAFFAGSNSPFSATKSEVSSDYTEGNTLLTQELLSETIRENINTYFEEAHIEDYISQEDMEKLIAEITTGVLNSIPQDMLSEEEMDEVRDIINEAIENITDEQNRKIEDTSSENKTIITEELKQYINEVIVPNISATIQINKGEIEDLKASIARREKLLSNEGYVKNAPANIVEEERNKLELEKEKLAKLKGIN